MTDMELAFNEEVEKMLDVLDEIIKTEIEPLMEHRIPSKVIGKPFEEWSAEDLQKAAIIFGQAHMEEYIGNKKVKELKELEAEEV